MDDLKKKSFTGQIDIFDDKDSKDEIRNLETLYCPYPKCKSIILLKGMGVLIFDGNSGKLSSNTMSTFWTVSSPFVFENLGFSKNIEGNIKFLTCADCDRGPLGYHDPNVLNNGEKEYLLGADKVMYGESSSENENYK
ncbi:hypothetical protein PCANB_002101 [Pneumocystis canis]|nr:hypothetical protein PCANB_002101 [Pneumocystis canis]